MRQRLISAAVLVPVVVVVFLAGRPWLTLGIAILAVLAAIETARLVRLAGLRSYPWLAITAPILSVLAFETVFVAGGVELGWTLIPAGFAAWLIVAALPALREPEPRTGLMAWLGTVFAGFFASLLAFAAGLANVRSVTQLAEFEFQIVDTGRLLLVMLVGVVWSYDSAAYVAGRYFGRGRFMYHISPAKTWSGVAGGTLAAVVVGAVLASYMLGIEPWWGALLGLLIGWAAQAGDLAESMLKRAAGVKDSGNLIPGHGGILDRVDSFLFAAPVLYALVVFASLARAGGLT